MTPKPTPISFARPGSVSLTVYRLSLKNKDLPDLMSSKVTLDLHPCENAYPAPCQMNFKVNTFAGVCVCVC